MSRCPAYPLHVLCVINVVYALHVLTPRPYSCAQLERLRDTEVDARARSSIPLRVCRVSALTLEAPCPKSVAVTFGGTGVAKFYTISVSGASTILVCVCVECVYESKDRAENIDDSPH